MIGLIIISHGDLGQALLRTAEGIVGSIDGIRTISNYGKSPELVGREIHEAVSSFNDPEGVLIMVDLFGSSCWRSGVSNAAELPNTETPVAVISGINLGTILSFSQKRDSLPFTELAEAMAEDARRGINGPKFFPGERA